MAVESWMARQRAKAKRRENLERKVRAKSVRNDKPNTFKEKTYKAPKKRS